MSDYLLSLRKLWSKQGGESPRILTVASSFPSPRQRPRVSWPRSCNAVSWYSTHQQRTVRDRFHQGWLYDGSHWPEGLPQPHCLADTVGLTFSPHSMCVPWVPPLRGINICRPLHSGQQPTSATLHEATKKTVQQLEVSPLVLHTHTEQCTLNYGQQRFLEAKAVGLCHIL